MSDCLRIKAYRGGKDLCEKASSSYIYINGEKCKICSKCCQVKNFTFFEQQCCANFCIRQKGAAVCQNCKEMALQNRQWSIKQIQHGRDVLDRSPLDEWLSQQRHQSFQFNNNIIQTQLQVSQSRQDLLAKMEKYFQQQDLCNLENPPIPAESLQSQFPHSHSESEPKVLLPVRSLRSDLCSDDSQLSSKHSPRQMSSSLDISRSDRGSQQSEGAYLSCERVPSVNSEYKTVPEISPCKLGMGQTPQRNIRMENIGSLQLGTNYELSGSTKTIGAQPQQIKNNRLSKSYEDPLFSNQDLQPYLQYFNGFKQGEVGQEFVMPQTTRLESRQQDQDLQSNPENPEELQQQMHKLTKSLLSQVDSVIFWQQELDYLKQRSGQQTQNLQRISNSQENIQVQQDLEQQLQQKLAQLMSQNTVSNSNSTQLRQQDTQQLENLRSLQEQTNAHQRVQGQQQYESQQNVDSAQFYWNVLPQVTHGY